MTRTIVEITAAHAQERGDKLAYAMLTDGTGIAAQMTFRELDARARTIGSGLLDHAASGDRAALVYETGLDFVTAFLACLYAGIVAIPVPAPEASRLPSSLARLDAVLRNSGAKLLLGNERTLGLLRSAPRTDAHATNSAEPPAWIDSADLLARPVSARSLPAPAEHDLAYLQYTSGSTSTPKGVMIDHANIVGHCAGMQAGLGYDADSVSVCWMPHFHDYGLIEGILVPLFNGTPSYLMSPFAFLKRPSTWLAAISEYGGTHTQAFNFAYRYCTRRVTPRERATLRLHTLRSAGNGGEPIHPDTSREFTTTFAECGLRADAAAPVFGLAEATLLVSAVPPGTVPVVLECDAAALGAARVVPLADSADAPSREVTRIVACGPPLPETRVEIVDPESRVALAAGQVGEVWVSAPGVARGYWGLEAESNETLRAHIAGDTSATRYLRTGDLGAMYDGQLYITARRKDVIIIHGLNHHPQDIEWTVQHVNPLLRADHGAAFSIMADGEERLCVVQEIERGEHEEGMITGLIDAIIEAVNREHGIALEGIALINRGSINKTTSGKIQRSAVRRGFLSGDLRTVASWRARTSPGSQR